MKKVLLVLLGITLLSCSTDDICECQKDTYKLETVILYNDVGVPYLGVPEKIILSSEVVVCQDEIENVELGNNLYYEIKCN